MLTFLRRIRRSLIESGSSRKYLLYAIGEVALVVIGILIALQINNWNEERKSQAKEIIYLTNISAELKEDSISFQKTWVAKFSSKKASLQLAKDYVNGKLVLQDTVEFINSIGYGGISGLQRFGQNNRTYNELMSTGNLSLISDDFVRNQVVDYYFFVQIADAYAESFRSGYIPFMNSVRPWNVEEPDQVNKSDIPRILEKCKSDEFHSVINKELTYAYQINRFVKLVASRSNELHNTIEEYLEGKQN